MFNFSRAFFGVIRNEVKGHQPILTVCHIVKTKKAKLQSFQDLFLILISKVCDVCL
jgi:hypothetical protein